MYSILANLILFASLGTMIYLLARALPRISDEQHNVITHTSAVDRLIGRLPMERMDNAISSFLEKFLRKLKVLVLKMDNVINNYLVQLRRHSPVHQEKQGEILKEKMEAMTEVKNSSVEKTPHNR